jgi:Tripartite tricarboxylate transporter family receptor
VDQRTRHLDQTALAGSLEFPFVQSARHHGRLVDETAMLPLDPFKDFTPVGRVMRDHWIVAVSPTLGVDSLVALVALGKSKPGMLTFPSSGVGSSPHLQAERFRMRAGFESTHVPYKDNPMADLIPAERRSPSHPRPLSHP